MVSGTEMFSKLIICSCVELLTTACYFMDIRKVQLQFSAIVQLHLSKLQLFSSVPLTSMHSHHLDMEKKKASQILKVKLRNNCGSDSLLYILAVCITRILLVSKVRLCSYIFILAWFCSVNILERDRNI